MGKGLVIKHIDKALVTGVREKHEEVISASQIGHLCERNIWYGYKGYRQNYKSRTKLTLEVGESFEKVIFKCLKKSAGVIFVSNDMLSVKREDNLCGTPDGIVTLDGVDYILDVKTMNNSNYAHFVKHNLALSYPVYYYQLQVYMGLYKLDKAILLAVNKNTSELHEQLIEYDEIVYSGLQYKAKVISERDTPPERLSQDPSFYVCSMCFYKTLCFKDFDEENHKRVVENHKRMLIAESKTKKLLNQTLKDKG